jgi:hypothetical protein
VHVYSSFLEKIPKKEDKGVQFYEESSTTLNPMIVVVDPECLY